MQHVTLFLNVLSTPVALHSWSFTRRTITFPMMDTGLYLFQNHCLFWSNSRSCCFTSTFTISSACQQLRATKPAQAPAPRVTAWWGIYWKENCSFFYDCWRIRSSVAPRFPSPPCGFEQMKYFCTCFLVQLPPHSSSTTLHFHCSGDWASWRDRFSDVTYGAWKSRSKNRLVWSTRVLDLLIVWWQRTMQTCWAVE